jgi:hypothetical protein
MEAGVLRWSVAYAKPCCKPFTEVPMRLTRFMAATIFVLVGGPAGAQDKVDNPEFANWSKFKKGTSVTLKSVSSFNNMSSEASITSTLVEVGADKLVIEMTSVVKSGGMEFKGEPMKRDVSKTVTLPKELKKEDFAKGKPPGTYEEGTETLKIAGMDVKTKWYKYKADMDGTKTEAKMWTSEDVPGIMVKSEMTTSGAVTTKTTMEITELKKP